jgi:hypothetical protein
MWLSSILSLSLALSPSSFPFSIFFLAFASGVFLLPCCFLFAVNHLPSSVSLSIVLCRSRNPCCSRLVFVVALRVLVLVPRLSVCLSVCESDLVLCAL